MKTPTFVRNGLAAIALSGAAAGCNSIETARIQAELSVLNTYTAKQIDSTMAQEHNAEHFVARQRPLLDILARSGEYGKMYTAKTEYEKRGDTVTANETALHIAELKMREASEPGNTNSSFNYMRAAKFYQEAGQMQNAQDAADKAIDLFVHDFMYMRAAEVCEIIGDTPRRTELLNKGYKGSLDRGEYTEAIHYLKDLLKTPDDLLNDIVTKTKVKNYDLIDFVYSDDFKATSIKSDSPSYKAVYAAAVSTSKWLGNTDKAVKVLIKLGADEKAISDFMADLKSQGYREKKKHEDPTLYTQGAEAQPRLPKATPSAASAAPEAEFVVPAWAPAIDNWYERTQEEKIAHADELLKNPTEINLDLAQKVFSEIAGAEDVADVLTQAIIAQQIELDNYMGAAMRTDDLGDSETANLYRRTDAELDLVVSPGSRSSFSTFMKLGDKERAKVGVTEFVKAIAHAEYYIDFCTSSHDTDCDPNNPAGFASVFDSPADFQTTIGKIYEEAQKLGYAREWFEKAGDIDGQVRVHLESAYGAAERGYTDDTCNTVYIVNGKKVDDSRCLVKEKLERVETAAKELGEVISLLNSVRTD